MEKFIERLVPVLIEEKGIHEALLKLSKEKKEVILSNAVDSLDRIVNEEYALVARLEQCEDRRRQCVYDFSKRSGKLSTEIVITDFIDIAVPEQKHLIRRLQEDINILLKELKEINDINGRLVEQKLNYIQFTVDLVTGEAESGVYGMNGDGRQQIHNSPRLYDQKV